MIYLKSFNLPKDSWVDFYFSRPFDSRNWPKDLPKVNKEYSADERTIHNSYYPWKTFYGRGFEHIDFRNITIFYGGNASGKTTQWYELDNMKTYFQLFNAHRQEFEM